MQNEIWKPIDKIIKKNGAVSIFEGYEVSNYGRVRTYKRRYGRVAANVHNRPLNSEPYVINGRLDQAGYVMYCLSDVNKVRKNFRAHTLVMQMFVGLPEEYNVICHYDDVKTNNHLSNLRYDTQKANLADRIRNSKK